VPPCIPVAPGPILVVGDIICDHYVWGDVERVSPEAPVQVLRWEREADRPGGAANVAMNLAALGCTVHLAGIVGKDAAGQWLLRALGAAGVNTRGVIETADRPTTSKTRVIAQGQHLLRIDREVRHPITKADERRLVSAIARVGRRACAVICSDYAKGVLTKAVLAACTAGPRRRRARLVLVDPKGRDFGKYRGADLLTPNEKELMQADLPSELPQGQQDSVAHRAELMVKALGLRAILVTRGPHGMDLFEAERSRRRVRHTHIPVLQRHEVFDVTGAGDTVAAAIGLAAAAGLPLADAARLANAAAGIVVGTVGTTVADAETLAHVIDGEASQARAKVLSKAALVARVADARARGARIVVTNGCFDLLHVGHLHLLQRARALGDLLVVAINADRSVRRLKGPNRPVIPAAQRAEMLAALAFVDYVVVFPEPTPLRLIQAVRPDVLVKGGDYTPDQIVGRQVVERRGGQVVVVPQLPGLSTSKLVDTIHGRGDRGR
jgi:D-beta-D-heptose 7-phosphate kinase/D-beta-D-heptose 1-phosphate adenosyltransferase